MLINPRDYPEKTRAVSRWEINPAEWHVQLEQSRCLCFNSGPLVTFTYPYISPANHDSHACNIPDPPFSLSEDLKLHLPTTGQHKFADLSVGAGLLADRVLSSG